MCNESKVGCGSPKLQDNLKQITINNDEYKRVEKKEGELN